MNTSYQIVEAKSMDGGELAISLPWEFELSEIFVVAEHEKSGIAKVYEGSGTLTVDGDGNLVVPALFGGDAFRVWVSRKTQIRHDYDSGGDVIDDKTIDSELKELSRKTVENEKELARSVRVPEGGVNMILPSKTFRAGEISGFDDEGNVAVGKGVPRIAELYANFEKVESSRKEAARHESVAKQNADIAIENRIAANKSAEEAEEYAKQLSRVYKYCGTVATESALPTTGNSLGDVWNVSDTGLNYAWDGEAWDALAGDKYVTQNTAQEISAVKTFLKDLVLSGANTALRFFPLWDGDVFTRLESTKVKSSIGAFKRLEAIDVTGDARTFDFPLSSGMLATTDDLAQKANDTDVVHLTGEETIAGPKKFTSSINIGGKTLLETNVGSGVLKFAPVGSTAQTVLKRDGTNVVVQTQNAGVVQTTWTLPGGKTGTVALDSDVIHNTGDETITGNKRFDGSITVCDLYSLEGNLTIGHTPLGPAIRGFFGVFNELSVLPLGTTTALGADAYGLHVSATGGLQLFGTHFLNGTLWDDTVSPLMPGLKIVNNNLSLYSTDSAAIGFDYADTVFFRTMPNSGNEATYYFQAWEWTDDSHTTKAATAGVKLLKPSQATELVPTSVLNMEEGDARWMTRKNPAWTVDYGTPIYAEFTAESTSADFGIHWDNGGTPYNLIFPTTSGTIALTSDIPDTSKFPSGTLSQYGFTPDYYFTFANGIDLGGYELWGGNHADRYTFPAKSGTVALTSDLDNYVTKSGYDALLARVEALEAAAG